MRSDRTSVIRSELIRRDLDDGVVDVLALEHSSADDNPTNNDGIGIVWRLQDKTALSKLKFEGASLDVVGTDLALGAQDVDFNFYQYIAGAETNTFSIDADGGFKIKFSPLIITSAAATTEVQIDNTATDGDPYISFALSSVRKFSLGVDDGDSDKLKLGTTAIGTGTIMEWDTEARILDDTKLAFGNASDATFEYDENGTDNLRYDGVDMVFDVATKLLFRDSALFVFSSGDGQLDLDADTELELTAPTVQIAASTKFDVDSNAIDLGTNAEVDVVITFLGTTADGVLSWMEDEDYFQFTDDALLLTTENLYFRDTAIHLNSSVDGQLDIDADTEIEITSPTVQIVASTAFDVDSNAIYFGTGGEVDVAVNFIATTSSGLFTWMEDEDYFAFADDILINLAETLFFRDAAIYLNSSVDGQLDIDADVEIEITAPTVQIAASTAFDVDSNAISFGTGGEVDVAVNFIATTSSGLFTWMEDEDYFQYSDDIILLTTENLFFRDTAIHLNSSVDGQLDIDADIEVELTAPTIDIIGRITHLGPTHEALYHWKEDFDDEISGVQWEGGIRADYWTTGGTNYNANNVTYAGGAGGTVAAITAGADDDSVFSFGNTIFRIDANCILEARFKVLDITNVFIGVGFVEGSFVDKATPDDDICVVGIDSDNGHGFGAASIVAITNDNNAGAVFSDCGVDITLDTYITIRIDLTDTEQPRIWVNNTGGVITAANEVTPASITGTVQAGISVGAYFMVQSLSALADTFTIDYIEAWEDRA